jgi:hypothetical protein
MVAGGWTVPAAGGRAARSTGRRVQVQRGDAREQQAGSTGGTGGTRGHAGGCSPTEHPLQTPAECTWVVQAESRQCRQSAGSEVEAGAAAEDRPVGAGLDNVKCATKPQVAPATATALGTHSRVPPHTRPPHVAPAHTQWAGAGRRTLPGAENRIVRSGVVGVWIVETLRTCRILSAGVVSCPHIDPAWPACPGSRRAEGGAVRSVAAGAALAAPGARPRSSVYLVRLRVCASSGGCAVCGCRGRAPRRCACVCTCWAAPPLQAPLAVLLSSQEGGMEARSRSAIPDYLPGAQVLVIKNSQTESSPHVVRCGCARSGGCAGRQGGGGVPAHSGGWTGCVACPPAAACCVSPARSPDRALGRH